MTWTVEERSAPRRIRFVWRESGVVMPESGQPRRRGYGSQLIERALPYQLRARTMLEFGQDGVRCVITVDAAEPADGQEDAHGATTL